MSENEALQVQNQLKEIGIKVNIVNVPIEQVPGRQRADEARVRHDRVQLDRDAVSLHRASSRSYGTGQESNYAQLSLPEVDATDQADRRGDRQGQADRPREPSGEDHLGERAPLPLYQRPELKATKSKLANYGAFGFSDKSFHWENVGYEK